VIDLEEELTNENNTRRAISRSPLSSMSSSSAQRPTPRRSSPKSNTEDEILELQEENPSDSMSNDPEAEELETDMHNMSAEEIVDM
jgi:hypothetical protein